MLDLSDINSPNIIDFDDPEQDKSIIKVIGVGGGGGNAVNHMFREGIHDVTYVLCNTDNKALGDSPVPNKLQLGKEGLGAGNRPERARQAAEESIEEIRNMLDDGTKMVFITAGMGGGTGTGAAPIIAQCAKDSGILTVGIVSNHGNWFTAKNKNKELEVLCNAYDYLLFLTDDGLANFICDIFSIPECLEAFEYSYTKVEGSARKNDNIFTKSCITYEADLKLSEYFRTNMPKINRWFNVLNQDDPSVENLIEQLRELVK